VWARDGYWVALAGFSRKASGFSTALGIHHWVDKSGKIPPEVLKNCGFFPFLATNYMAKATELRGRRNEQVTMVQRCFWGVTCPPNS
jgi:hypothetical protein